MTTATIAHPVLIFDSGIGGLSISDELRLQLPNLERIYVADNRIFPYGTLPEAELSARILSLIPELIERFAPQLIIIACNSASTLILESLRQLTAIPIVGVVPAIKTAAERSSSRTIGLLATPGTIKRPYTHNLIQQFAQDCNVIQIGSHELVQEAENKLRHQPVDMKLLSRIVAPFMQSKALDQLVLGCTHFPFLKPELQSIMGKQVAFVDSGHAIARRTLDILTRLPNSKSNPNTNSSRCIFTLRNNQTQQLIPSLQIRGYSHIEFIEK